MANTLAEDVSDQNPQTDPFFAEAMYYLSKIAEKGISLGADPPGEPLEERQIRLQKQREEWINRCRRIPHLPFWIQEELGLENELESMTREIEKMSLTFGE